MALILAAPKPFTVNSSTSAAITPASNLNIDHPTMVWRSGTLTSVQLTIQTDGTAWDTVCLFGTNLRATDTVRVRAASSAANTTVSPTYDSGNLAAFSGTANTLRNMFLLTLPVASPRTEAFIRIDITSTGNPAGYVEASRLVIAKRVEEEGIDTGYEQGFEDASDVNMYRGMANVTPYNTRISNKFTITGIKDASYQTNWYPMLRDYGMKKGLLLIPDTLSSYTQNDAIFGLIVNAAKGSAMSSDFWKLELYIRSL